MFTEIFTAIAAVFVGVSAGLLAAVALIAVVFIPLLKFVLMPLFEWLID